MQWDEEALRRALQKVAREHRLSEATARELYERIRAVLQRLGLWDTKEEEHGKDC